MAHPYIDISSKVLLERVLKKPFNVCYSKEMPMTNQRYTYSRHFSPAGAGIKRMVFFFLMMLNTCVAFTVVVNIGMYRQNLALPHIVVYVNNNPHNLEYHWSPEDQFQREDTRRRNSAAESLWMTTDAEGEIDTPVPCIVDSEFLAQRRKQVVTRAAYLAKRASVGKKTGRSKNLTSSIGERRVGSATLNREGKRATSQIMDVIHSTARGAVAGEDGNASIDDSDTMSTEPIKSSLGVSQSTIYAAIDGMLRNQDASMNYFPENDGSNSFNTVIESFGRTFEVLHSSLLQAHGLIQDNSIHEHDNENRIEIRLATPDDDFDIANLRLSVFSDFSKELKGQFCSRSCQAISARRMRGATCLVATMPCRDSIEGSKGSIIVGSAECSFHEFFNTRLGRRRRPNSILYVTEVAVNPSTRRRGIATKLLKAIDELARKRNVETLYLHVDTANLGAIKLYKKSGYRKVYSNDPMYLEFTTSLNLHPGATKGRDHFLFYRNLTPEPVWLDEEIAKEQEILRKADLVGVLGFEIPA
jgi:ribosomal protein S18 acetylase RimI-like enzyme